MIKKNHNIGIFSGSFDPLHKGHLHISKIFIKKFKLNKLYWSLAKVNPLVKKKYFFSYEERLKLLRKKVKGYKKMTVSDIHKKYSIQLIKGFLKKYKNKKFFFLVGADNLKSFHKWKDYKQIMNLVTLVFISRPGYDKDLKKTIIYKKHKNKLIKNFKNNEIINEDSWFFIKDKGINISSSKLKNRLYKKN